MTINKTLSLNKPNRSYLVKKHIASSSKHEHGRPAVTLMTDFDGKSPVTVTANTHIDAALEQMIEDRIRLLFVVSTDGRLLGSITSYDIQGEKPMLYMQSQDCRIGICSRMDIEAQDIMTPVSKWKTVNFEDIQKATINDIAQTFLSLGQHHIIVVETAANKDTANVRGIFSFSDLERTYGTLLMSEKAESFSEIERALNS